MRDYPKIDKPTEPGWYWVRLCGDLETADVGFVNGLCDQMEAWINGMVYAIDDETLTDWRGPLPEPTNA